MPPSPPSDSGGEEPPIDDFIGPYDEFRPPLPPEDRIWRHPSEVAAAARTLPTAPAKTVKPSGGVSIATVAISALIGATLSLGVVAVLGGFDERVVERRVAVDVAARDDGDGTHAAVGLTTPSVVGVSVLIDDEWASQNGLVLRSDGHLLTAAGPLQGSRAVEVHLSDGEALEADVVGVDLATDVAVIRVDHQGLTPAVIGTAEHLRVGDDAMAVGLLPRSQWKPLLTNGVIRAVGQRANAGDTTYHDLVVIDANLGAEAAGAPVLDHRGAVVGMLASEGVAVSSGGTAVIPIDDAVHIAEEILEFGRARHVWLGVGGHDMTRDEMKDLQLSGGAVISSVFDDSPADLAGVEVGDVIVAIDGSPVASMSSLVTELRDRDPGEHVELSIERDGDAAAVVAELAERSDS